MEIVNIRAIILAGTVRGEGNAPKYALYIQPAEVIGQPDRA